MLASRTLDQKYVSEEPQCFSIQSLLTYKIHHIGAIHERIGYDNLTRITGLTLSQWRVVGNIASGLTTFTELLNELLLDPGQLSNIIKQLQEKKLIEKNKSNIDRRQIFLSISPLGQEIVGTVIEIADKFQKVALRNLSSQEVEVLEQSLVKIEANMRQFWSEINAN
jgi:DNA-binding MarR family transcriptional regulator